MTDRLMTLVALLLVTTAGAAPAPARTDTHLPVLERFLIGDPNLPTPDPVEPGLLLMGGGDHDPDAMHWFLARAGHGRIVVLRASMTTDVADEIYRQLQGAISVETFVFHDRKSASNPHLLDSLRNADGIFIAGGDQSRYVRFWKGTEVAHLIDRHVASGRPLAGTSAGLAILGEYLFSAMTPANVTSDAALHRPLGRDVTIDHDFLHLDVLKGYITDSHFDRRLRLGRLVAFMSRADTLAARSGGDVEGLGIDEGAALAVLADGEAHVYSHDPSLGATWIHDVPGNPHRGKPLETGALRVTYLGVQSEFNLRAHEARNPRDERIMRVMDGELHPR